MYKFQVVTINNWIRRGVMIKSYEMDSVTRAQILDETICILHSPHTLGKVMDPTILPPAMGKLLGKLGSFTLYRQPD